MPGTRLPVAERLVFHLIEFGIELNDLVIRIAVVYGHIVPRTKPQWTPENGNFLLTEQVAGVLQVSEILQFEREVMHTN